MWRLALILALLAPTPALTEDAPARKFPPRKPIECYCTNTQGARVEMGETICLKVDGRSFMAQCSMSLNVPIWREVAKGCTSS